MAGCRRFGKNALVLLHAAGGAGQLVAQPAPADLLVGLCCGGLVAAVPESKNAKKYRHGMEYGSAGETQEDIAPYIDPVFQNNVDSDENGEPDK